MNDNLYKISAILILVAALLYFFFPTLAAWIMVFAVATFIVLTAKNPYPGKSVRGKRLFGFQIFACMLMAVAAYLMLRERNEWVVAMLIAAFLQLYAAIIIPKELEKEKNETNNK
ncbi:MAG: hypothetical protein LBI15_02180 [Dysgonamonadaceae bacterium]|jgi:hypothetical protein|nr:hypothetical protein [Dysgonamonadaceae bacterium]